MKKVIFILLLLTALLLSGCMPGDYSDELLKATKKEYLAKGEAWFDENLPSAKVQVMDYVYNGSSLSDALKGSYKTNGKLVKYMLMPDSGELYTNELYPELADEVQEQFCARTGLGADSIDDLFVLWEIPYNYLPGDLEEKTVPWEDETEADQPIGSAEVSPEITDLSNKKEKTPATTGERMLPYGYTSSDMNSLAREILTDPESPTLIGLYLEATDPMAIDLNRFLGLAGLTKINIVTSDSEDDSQEEAKYVYEIKSIVSNNDDGSLCQTLRLIKRKEMSTKEEVLKEVSGNIVP